MKPLNEQVIYLGVENPVVFLSGKDSLCNEILELPSSLSIRKDLYSCIHWLKPISSDTPAFVKIKNEKIDFSHKLKKVPNPTWTLNNSNCEVSLDRLKSSYNFLFWQQFFDYEATIKVTSYDVKVYRDGLLEYFEKVDGKRFSYEFKSFIQNNDEVIFSNIIIQAPEGIRKLNDINFKVVQEKQDGFFKRLFNKLFRKN